MRRHVEQERMPFYTSFDFIAERSRTKEDAKKVNFSACALTGDGFLCGPPCVSSPEGKIEKQVCITTLLPHRHITCKNTPGNKTLYMESSIEESKLESS